APQTSQLATNAATTNADASTLQDLRLLIRASFARSRSSGAGRGSSNSIATGTNARVSFGTLAFRGNWAAHDFHEAHEKIRLPERRIGRSNRARPRTHYEPTRVLQVVTSTFG